MAAAQPLDGFPVPAVVASLATDGIDGASDAAGGVVDDRSVHRAKSWAWPHPGDFLARSDSWSFLGPLGDLILTGPTGTNVVDITVLLAAGRAGEAIIAASRDSFGREAPVLDDEPADGLEGPDKGGEEPRDRAVLPDESSASASSELPIGPNAALEFHRRARLAEDRLAEVLAAYRQIKTENEDFRDRTTRNIERRFEQRRERLLLKFMDILDNLDRALDAAEHAGNPLIEGLILVRTQLLQTLQEEGLERIPSLGLQFDPAVAESVGSQPVEEPEHHHVVVKELLRGYRLNGRIARASRVVIGVVRRGRRARR